MTTPTYEPTRYWGDLVGDDFTLRGVGYPELSLSFNAFAYRLHAIDRLSLRLVSDGPSAKCVVIRRTAA